jgi:Ulp1 family protease
MTYLFSFKDLPVYSCDLDLFRDRQWLNDVCIGLAYRLMDDELLTSDQCDRYSSASTATTPVLLLDPAVVSFLQLQVDDDDEYQQLAGGLAVNSFEWLFLPVNDRVRFDAESTHWSLLVCHVPTGSLFHCDSHGNYNSPAVHLLAPKLQRLLLLSTTSITSTTMMNRNRPKAPAIVVSIDVPQQRNGYDCGVYVVLFTKCLVSLVRNTNVVDIFAEAARTALNEQIHSSDCNQFRTDILHTVQLKFGHQ